MAVVGLIEVTVGGAVGVVVVVVPPEPDGEPPQPVRTADATRQKQATRQIGFFTMSHHNRESQLFAVIV